MKCHKDFEKSVNSCKNCPLKIKECPHHSIFLDSSIFLKIILRQSEDPKRKEEAFEKLKVNCVTYTSHLAIGEIFKVILEEFEKELEKNKRNAQELFRDNCDHVSILLKGVCLIEEDKEAISNANEIITDGRGNRDSILLATAVSHKCMSFFTCDRELVERTFPNNISDSIKIRLF